MFECWEWSGVWCGGEEQGVGRGVCYIFLENRESVSEVREQRWEQRCRGAEGAEGQAGQAGITLELVYGESGHSDRKGGRPKVEIRSLCPRTLCV